MSLRKRKVNPPSQNLLGVFVDGMPKKASEIPKTVVELMEQPDNVYPRRPSENLDDGEYAYNDMLNRAKDIVFNVHGFRVIVCPHCKSDVEWVRPKVVKPVVNLDEKLVWSNPNEKERLAFVSCGKCNLHFFLPELVLQRSFRFPFPNEDVESYYLFLKCVWLKGSYRILHGDAVEDVSDSPDGDTWVGYGENADDQ